MDPIPAWVRRLWDMWDVRILVLLSLTLQIILYILGNRRKYISSLWINIVVWSAYLMADLVAIVALGKLSDVQVYLDVNNANLNNALRAIWAPLLLLHLGGPDTITAYSLEDNQLWMRHFMGLGVQATVAVYVILMSWKNSWFSLLALLAFVAGIIKYGQRTWILKSVTDDESGDIVPFGNAGKQSLGTTTRDDKYLSGLVMAHYLLGEFKRYMMNYNISISRFPLEGGNRIFTGDVTSLREAIEIEMELMYDLLYTKASKMYTKGGCILRSISFASTASLLIGFFWLISRKEKWQVHYSMIDIVITGILLVGALALEIYGVILLLSSDWTVLWLIKHNKSNWVKKTFPWFFPSMLKKRKGSNMIGQFDLLDFCVKEANRRPTKLGAILGLLGIREKLKWHLHSTRVPAPPNLNSMFSDFVSGPNARPSSYFPTLTSAPVRLSLYERILSLYLMTEMWYYQPYQEEDDALKQVPTCLNTSASGDDDRGTCRILSRYMIYILLTCPALMPDGAVSVDRFRLVNDHLKSITGNAQDVSKACEKLWELYNPHRSVIPHNIKGQCVEQNQRTVQLAEMACHVSQHLAALGWAGLKDMWMGMLIYAAITSNNKNGHLQQLRQGGGDLITWLWFFIPQCDTIGIDSMELTTELTKLCRK